MKLSSLLFLALCLTVANAQDSGKSSPDQALKAPEGWKYVTAKDGSYQFLFPNDTTASGSRDQTSRRGGLNSRTQINYCTLKDGTGLVVAASNLSGPAPKGLK